MAKTKIQSFLKKPHNDYIIIGAIIGLILILNIIWIFTETRPPHWDMARHLWTSLQYMSLLKHGKFYGLLAHYYYYPPVLYLATLPLYTVFGTAIASAVMTNSIFITVVAFTMYGTGKTLWGRRTGLLAAMFLLCSPMLVTQFKEFQVDAPLTAMVSLTLYLLVKNRDFVSAKLSILLGLSLGLGMLTKWTFVFIILMPIVVSVLIGTMASYKERSWNRVRNMALMATAAYVTASIWYITNLHQLMIDLTQNGVGAGAREGDPLVGTFASNIWYGWNAISNQLYLIPSILLIIGIGFLFVKKQNVWKNRYPILITAGTLLFFTILRNKDARYTLPALTGISILATYWISRVRAKTYISVGLVLYLLITFYLISFGNRYLPKAIVITRGDFPITVYAQKGYIIGPPSGENWQLEEIFKHISAASLDPVKLYYQGPDTMWLNSWDLLYYAHLYNIQLTDKEEAADFVLLRSDPEHQSSRGGLQLPDGGTLVLKEHK